MGKGRTLKALVLLVLLSLLVLAWWWLMFTPTGQELAHHPHRVAKQAHTLIDAHRVIAPLVVIAIYIALTVLALPVWWLQVMAGFAFGLWFGVLWCDLAAAAGAMAAFGVSRWLAAEWFHKKVESRMTRLRKIDDKLGHNGFLVVMLVRLSHVAPFGLSNYMFGLVNINVRDVALGTLLGGIPTTTIYVMLGHNPHGMRGHFWLAIVILNILLLMPVLLRYLRPGWFRKMGIE